MSYILSIVAIELTLKWNKVLEIYSIASIGQYVPLTVGVGSFISICWRLVQQEGVSMPVRKCSFLVYSLGLGAET